MKVLCQIALNWVLILLTGLLMFVNSPALAQHSKEGRNTGTPGYSGAPGSNDSSSTAIDDDTLKRTARAYVKVRRISAEEMTSFKNATDDALRQNVEQQAELQKEAAVKTEGLRPELYNQVLALVQTNKAVEQRFFSYVNQTS
jgi:hypothetical protein